MRFDLYHLYDYFPEAILPRKLPLKRYMHTSKQV